MTIFRVPTFATWRKVVKIVQSNSSRRNPAATNWVINALVVPPREEGVRHVGPAVGEHVDNTLTTKLGQRVIAHQVRLRVNDVGAAMADLRPRPGAVL